MINIGELIRKQNKETVDFSIVEDKIIFFPSRDYYSEEEAKAIEGNMFVCFESDFFDESCAILDNIEEVFPDISYEIKGMC